MAPEISLANKCQLLFGAAAVFIISAALLIPWMLLGSIADRSEWDACRLLAEVSPKQPGIPTTNTTDQPPETSITWIPWDRAPNLHPNPFIAAAAKHFEDNPDATEHKEAIREDNSRVYRFAARTTDTQDQTTGLFFIERHPPRRVGRLFVDRLYLLSAGLLALALAVLVFYLITTRIILSPVRSLRDTAERISSGNLGMRAEIHTGDEFQQLSESFNDMLNTIELGQDQLRGINRSLDDRVGQLSEANIALHETAQIKADFLASMSHELRTPLNSIIGFAELLESIAQSERPGQSVTIDADQYAKRRRYLNNIVDAGRALLDMINDLLDMAKIEAGKMDLHVTPTNITELCETLVALIRPQADRKDLTLSIELPISSPAARTTSHPQLIETDARKLHQIVFNFLSNAVKFTPDSGEVILRAERIHAGDTTPSIRISVLDTGPGLPHEDQQRIFEKFVQLDAGHTRQHTGTGLGLAICKDLAAMIQGEIQLVSDPGQGSMFSIVIPERMNPDLAAAQAIQTAGLPAKTIPTEP